MPKFYSVESKHGEPSRTGILLVNLGTPDSPSVSDVRRYLREFLWDPRVVEAPRPVWWMVLNGIILTTRPARSAKAYAKIWTENGSPLLHLSQQLTSALDDECRQQGLEWDVRLAMRYGQPSIESVMQNMWKDGIRRILVVPLYPQYSATTTATVFDEVTRVAQKWRFIPELRFINSYHDFKPYIHALAQSVQEYWSNHEKPEKLVMSFHGIPQEYFDSGDPYFCHCQKTARLLAEKLGLSKDDWMVTFQSRLGPKKWLQPYTDHTLTELAKSGVKNIQVICPGFSVDCLETLEEIAMENKDTFLEAGGETYEYIPCLNHSSDHVECIKLLADKHLKGWESNSMDSEMKASRERAIDMGAKQ